LNYACIDSSSGWKTGWKIGGKTVKTGGKRGCQRQESAAWRLPRKLDFPATMPLGVRRCVCLCVCVSQLDKTA